MKQCWAFFGVPDAIQEKEYGTQRAAGEPCNHSTADAIENCRQHEQCDKRGIKGTDPTSGHNDHPCTTDNINTHQERVTDTQSRHWLYSDGHRSTHPYSDAPDPPR
jgi:hypothetical protein